MASNKGKGFNYGQKKLSLKEMASNNGNAFH